MVLHRKNAKTPSETCEGMGLLDCTASCSEVSLIDGHSRYGGNEAKNGTTSGMVLMTINKGNFGFLDSRVNFPHCHSEC